MLIARDSVHGHVHAHVERHAGHGGVHAPGGEARLSLTPAETVHHGVVVGSSRAVVTMMHLVMVRPEMTGSSSVVVRGQGRVARSSGERRAGR